VSWYHNHPVTPTLAIFWVFWCKVKITQANAQKIRMDCHPILTNWCPHLCHPPFLWRMAQPSQFILAWDRHQVCWLAYPVAWFCMPLTGSIREKMLEFSSVMSSAYYSNSRSSYSEVTIRTNEIMLLAFNALTVSWAAGKAFGL